MRIPDQDYNDRELLALIGRQESLDVNWGIDYKEQLNDRLKNGEIITGAKYPWSKTHDIMRARPGEITIWGGMSGHKKSMLTGFATQYFARNQRIGIMSFEMPVISTMERLVKQAAGCHPGVQFGDKWAQWSDERICFYDRLDTVPVEKVLGVLHYMAAELKCEHVIIDSLTKCSIAKKDTEGEKRFLDLLSATAKALNLHIHLVCHVRKPDTGGDDYIPNKFDIRGAGEITDQADNVFIVWQDKRRDKIKAKKEKGSFPLSDKETKYLAESYDQKLIVAKQRHGTWEGTIGLYFNDQSLQFLSDEKAKPVHLI